VAGGARGTRVRVDLHLHSSASFDCRVAPLAVARRCRQRGLSPIFLTDHEGIDGARSLVDAGQDAIVGEEILTTEGELIGLFLKESVPARLSPEEAVGLIAPDSVPFWDLPSLRAAAETAGLDGTRYRLQFQMLLARPLLFIAMVLIAAAFSLRFFRFGGIEKMVSGGVGAGFVLYVAVKFVGDLGGAGLLSPLAAAWSPAVVASLLGASALLSQEDG